MSSIEKWNINKDEWMNGLRTLWRKLCWVWVSCALNGFWEKNGKVGDYLRGFGILLAGSDDVNFAVLLILRTEGY